MSDAKKFYEAKKYKEAAALMEDSMKLQAFQSVLTYDLALCYYQLGDRPKAMEYLTKAKAGTVEPKQRQKVLQLMAMLVTGENGISVNEGEKPRIAAGEPIGGQHRTGSVAWRRWGSGRVVGGKRYGGI